MAKNTPAFQFYPSDFLGGTDLMSAAAVGVYVRLMCRIWINGGSLPYCTAKLAIVCMITESEFLGLWPEMADKFDIDSDVLKQPRLSHMIEVSASRAMNGSQGGRPKKAKQKQIGKQNKSKTESKTKANPLKYEDRSMKYEVCSSEDGNAPIQDDWIFPTGWDRPDVREVLDEFAEMRYSINKRIKSRSMTSRIFKRFDSPEHLIYAAEHCIANQYQGLKPEYRPEKQMNGKAKTFVSQAADAMGSEIAEFLGVGEQQRRIH